MGNRILDRVKFLSGTTGAGTITVGAAISGYRTPVTAGAAVGDVVHLVIEDGAAWEKSLGVMVTTTTISRTLIESSTGALLNLSGNQNCYLSEIDADSPSKLLIPATDYGGASLTEIDMVMASGFRAYELDVWDFRPATDDATGVILQFSFNGSTYPASKMVQVVSSTLMSTAGAFSPETYGAPSGTPGEFYIFDGIASATGSSGKAHVKISVSESSGADESLQPQLLVNYRNTLAAASSPASGQASGVGGGYCITTGRPAGLRIKTFNGRTIATARARLTGLR